MNPSLLREDAGNAGLRTRVLALRSMPFLSDRHSAELTALGHHARVRSWAAGDVMIEAGAEADVVLLITRGVAAYVAGEQVVQRFEAPGSVGLLPLLSGMAVPFDVRAETDVTALVLPDEAMLAFFEDSFASVEQALRGLAQALLERRGRLPCDPSNPPEAHTGVYPERPIDFVDRLLKLSSLHFFSRVNLDALAELARRQQEVRFSAGDVIWTVGDRSDAGVRIEYGIVRCEGPAGAVDIGSDYALGLFDALARVPRAYSLRATTDVVALTMSPEAIYGVIEEHFELGRGLLAAIATQHMALTTDSAHTWTSA